MEGDGIRGEFRAGSLNIRGPVCGAIVTWCLG